MKNVCFLLVFVAGIVSFGEARAGTVPFRQLDGGDFSLSVEWNNPFSPRKGEHTVFRYAVPDPEREVLLRVLTLSGEPVREWSGGQGDASRERAVTWDGTNDRGEVVAEGIYLVNLRDVASGRGITRKVAVTR